MKRLRIDLTGQVFGLLTVVSRGPSYVNGMSRWFCKCSCGGEAIVGSHHLRHKKRPTRSCGCLKLTARVTHGHTRKSVAKTHGFRIGGKTSREYNSWRGMRNRCLNPSSEHYKDYGGRGIKICPRWESFSLFLEDMGKRPEGTSLDRKQVDGDYEPNNCCWSTQSTQVKNQRPKLAIESFSDDVLLKEYEHRFLNFEYGLFGC